MKVPERLLVFVSHRYENDLEIVDAIGAWPKTKAIPAREACVGMFTLIGMLYGDGAVFEIDEEDLEEALDRFGEVRILSRKKRQVAMPPRKEES